MYFAIFSGVFLVVAALAVLFGALRARKKVWQFALSRIIMTVVAALLAVAVSLAISWLALGAVAGALIDNGTLGDIGNLAQEVPTAQTAVLAVASMVATPVLFLVFYSVFRPICSAFVRPLTRLMTKKHRADSASDAEPEGEERAEDEVVLSKKERKKIEFNTPKGHWLSALLGGVSGLLLLCVLLIPLVGGLGVINDISSVALHEAAADSSSEVLTTVADVLDAASGNVGTFTVKLVGGGLLYDLMTSYPTDHGFATLSRESELIGSLANAAVCVSDGNASDAEIKETMGEVSRSFDRSTLLPALTSELARAAAGDWKEGNDFHGIDCPSFGGERMEPVVLSLVDGLANSDTETIKQDVKTVVDVVTTLVINDTVQKLENDPMAILADEKATSEMLLPLLDNPRLCVVVDGVSDFGIGLLMDEVRVKGSMDGMYDRLLDDMKNASGEDEVTLKVAYAEIFDNYGLRVDDARVTDAALSRLGGNDMAEWTKANVASSQADFETKSALVTVNMITDGREAITDTQAEAKALAHAFAVIYSLMDDLGDDTFDAKVVLSSMGPALDSFESTQTIGPKRTEYILTALLQSELVHDKIGFSVLEATDSAQSISKNAKTRAYAGMMNSLSLIVDVVDAAADPSKSTHEAVEAMLADLTPESAEVVQTMATPNVVMNYGVPDRSSVPVSAMISDTFGNLSSAKENGMSDEEYARESAAVSDMMNVMMSTGTSENKALFGEGSSTNQSAAQYIDNIMDSKVMSETVVNTVYGEGDTPKNDPLASQRNISEGEQAEFIEATNSKWQASEKSEETKKELIAIAAVINVNIQLEGDTWVIVK